MLELSSIDLRDHQDARSYVKQESVSVSFAATDGTLQSRVGPNHYRAGDALVTGADGDLWCVARDRFESSYAPTPPLHPGQPGTYRNIPRAVLARRMDQPFAIRRKFSGDWLQGAAGDWLLQYAPGDHGIASAARFALVYRLAVPGQTPQIA